jgi:hypothetical protein
MSAAVISGIIPRSLVKFDSLTIQQIREVEVLLERRKAEATAAQVQRKSGATGLKKNRVSRPSGGPRLRPR